MKLTNTLFSIVFPYSFSAEDADSFLRHAGNVYRILDRLHLKENSWVSTDTYHNLFAKRKITVLTDYSDFSFNVVGIGNCIIEVIAITRNDHYSFESVLTSTHLEGDFTAVLPVANDFSCDALYVKITSIDDTEIITMDICAINNDPKPAKVAYCICSYNRESFIKQFVTDVASHFVNNPDIHFYLANNGLDYQIAFLENFTVMKNRNLGGAGGFCRAMITALEKDNYSHVILADDDIYLHKGVIEKTLSLLKGVKREFSDHFISGSMLSLEERWLQYERNSLLTDSNFVHLGHDNDTRWKQDALANAIVMPHKGLAGWWYCVIPEKVIKEFGFPLPVFVRGDDVEYSIRCSRKIISLNGICVWHEPFIKKYHEIMEDYYLCRNLLIVSFIYNSNYRKLRRKLVAKKFIRNILIFDYVSAEFNIMAIEHILDETYQQDADLLHQSLISNFNGRMAQIPVYHGDFNGYEDRRMGKFKTITLLILQHFLGLSCGCRTTIGGFRRSIMNFSGAREVHVYQGEQQYRIYRFQYFRSWSLITRFIRLNISMMLNSKRLQKTLIQFRDTKSQRCAWMSVFQRG